MRFSLDDLPQKYREQALKQINKDSATDTSADLEPPPRSKPLAKKKDQGHDSPCSISIHSIRKRLADSDGVSGKAAIDGLVHSGILEDDSPKFVKEVSFSQEKAKGREEETIITLTYD